MTTPIHRHGDREDRAGHEHLESFDGDDPLERLAELWAGLVPPPPGDDVGATDPVTRATVDWLARAWDQLDVPAVRPPAAAPRLAPRRALRPLAAAAVLLLLLGGPFFIGRPLITPEAATPAPPPLEPVPSLVAAADANHIELRSGPVRLILLTGNPQPDSLP